MNPYPARNLIIITTAKGMVPLLTAELDRLGYRVEGSTETGVSLWGGPVDVMKLNLHLRTAHRVLLKVGDGSARQPAELFKRLLALPWEQWIPPRGYVCVTSSGQSISGDDPRFVALKTKDALMDRLSQAHGFRPDSGPDRSRTVVHIHWERTSFIVYLDTSGESLAHRGYRLQPHKAPMRETLAAACLLGSGWDPATALVNPMCGSGTIAIEAALIASRTPPGFLRTNFGFMHLENFPLQEWNPLRDQAGRERLIRPNAIRILANDIDPRAIEASTANAKRAGMEPWINFRTCDFRQTPLPPAPGLLFFNPEYGERLGEDAELAAQYKAIGDFMKHNAPGYTGAVFTGNADMIKPIGLKPRFRLQLYNGPIEGRLLVFDLYGGTLRDRRLRATKNTGAAPNESPTPPPATPPPPATVSASSANNDPAIPPSAPD